MGAALGQNFIGIDVHSSRACPFAVIDGSGGMTDSGWLSVDSGLEREIAALVTSYPNAVFGVDSPRVARQSPREWYWRRRKWRPRRASEVGWGRHCEVVVKAHGMANPQWTPLESKAPEWMLVGFRIFAALTKAATVHEVFPTASYNMLEAAPEALLTMSFESFRPGPKDMLDAAIGALTVREFESGSGSEVGGGDGLGTIILPRPIPNPIEAVFKWPDSRAP